MDYPDDFGQQEVPSSPSRVIEALFWSAIAFAVTIYLVTL